MNTSPKSVRFDDDSLWVELSDGRVIAVPLARFPRLLHATPEQRVNVELSPNGLQWDELGEDVSVAGLLIGIGDQSRLAVPATYLLRLYGAIRFEHGFQELSGRRTAKVSPEAPNSHDWLLKVFLKGDHDMAVETCAVGV